MPLAEKTLIAGIRRQAAEGRGITVGVGDDAAMVRLPAGHEALVTTDFSLEGVHVRREWHSPESIGHRCLARGLSDIAAMGGRPLAAFLSLALPRDLPQRWVDGFLHGLLRLGKQFSTTLAGGDIAESRAGVLADIVVLGSVRRGRALLRSGARPGDRIYVTGELGASAAVLESLMKGHRPRPNDPRFRRHFFPEPRVEVGRFLSDRGLASAMIDVSDGLSTDLAHICEESRVGAEIIEDAAPIAGGHATLHHALHGGEDYELLFTSADKRMPKRIAGVRITEIGVVTRGRNILVCQKDGKNYQLKAAGWEHFTK